MMDGEGVTRADSRSESHLSISIGDSRREGQ